MKNVTLAVKEIAAVKRLLNAQVIRIYIKSEKNDHQIPKPIST